MNIIEKIKVFWHDSDETNLQAVKGSKGRFDLMLGDLLVGVLLYEDGTWSFTYSEKMPRGHWIANAALVWQSPIGPISLSTTYYSHGEYKWYPQINIGLLLFNKKSMED